MKTVYLIKHECAKCGYLDRVVQIGKCDYEFKCPKCGSTSFVFGATIPVSKEWLDYERVLEYYKSFGYSNAEEMAKDMVEATKKALEEVIEILGYNPLEEDEE